MAQKQQLIVEKPSMPCGASIVLFQPDIPQNLGAIMRLCACLGIALHIVEPCGFPLDDARMRRVGMDYIDQVSWHRHADWESFLLWARSQSRRILLMTTKSAVSYLDIAYRADDLLLFGRESAGVPEPVHQAADARLSIPMQSGARSLNLAMSAGIIAAEAKRQLLT